MRHVRCDFSNSAIDFISISMSCEAFLAAFRQFDMLTGIYATRAAAAGMPPQNLILLHEIDRTVRRMAMSLAWSHTWQAGYPVAAARAPPVPPPASDGPARPLPPPAATPASPRAPAAGRRPAPRRPATLASPATATMTAAVAATGTPVSAPGHPAQPSARPGHATGRGRQRRSYPPHVERLAAGRRLRGDRRRPPGRAADRGREPPRPGRARQPRRGAEGALPGPERSKPRARSDSPQGPPRRGP